MIVMTMVMLMVMVMVKVLVLIMIMIMVMVMVVLTVMVMVMVMVMVLTHPFCPVVIMSIPLQRSDHVSQNSSNAEATRWVQYGRGRLSNHEPKHQQLCEIAVEDDTCMQRSVPC